MARAQAKQPVRMEAAVRGRGVSIEKQLGIVVAIALLGAAITAAVVSVEHRFAPAPERQVTIYRTHGCKCAFTFARSLQAAGFDVRIVEYQTLKTVRASLRTPASLRGCHVGEYLDYFLEGHVSPAALPVLAMQRPTGLGLATESSAKAGASHVSIALDERSTVMLIGPNGEAQPWFEPVLEADR